VTKLPSVSHSYQFKDEYLAQLKVQPRRIGFGPDAQILGSLSVAASATVLDNAIFFNGCL